MGVAAQEAVVALETAAQWPAIVWAGRRDLIGRREVPFADGVGVVAVLQQHFGQHAVLERNVSVSAGIAGRAFGDAGHGVGVVVAAGHDAGPRGRAERRGVHVVEEQAFGGERVDIGRRDRASIAAHLAKAGIVLDDEDNVRRAVFGAQRLGPGRAGYIECAADNTGERRSGFVFLEGHSDFPFEGRILVSAQDRIAAPAKQLS